MEKAQKLIQELVPTSGTSAPAKPGETLCYFQRVIARGEIPVSDLADSVATFLFAGVDTINHLLMWLVLNVARYPEVQEKIHKEICEVLGDEVVVTKSHLDRMHYLKWVIRENNRLTPLSPVSTYRVLHHPLEVAGYDCPTLYKYDFCVYSIQNDPELVDEVTSFIPERWSPEAVRERKGTPKEAIDAAIVARPFGWGPRMSLGASFGGC